MLLHAAIPIPRSFSSDIHNKPLLPIIRVTEWTREKSPVRRRAWRGEVTLYDIMLREQGEDQDIPSSNILDFLGCEALASLADVDLVDGCLRERDESRKEEWERKLAIHLGFGDRGDCN